MTKERPILFSSPMVRAILEGRKTQTRRLIKPEQPTDYKGARNPPPPPMKKKHEAAYFDEYADGPYWCWWDEYDRQGPDWIKCPWGNAGDRLWVRETAIIHVDVPQLVGYVADGCDVTEHWECKVPSMLMPRWACRITLEITDVRVERLQDISEEDAIADGFASKADFAAYEWCAPIWDSNPFVWAVSFRRIDQAEKSKAA